MTTSGVLLRGVDRSAFAVSFAVRLRAVGVPVGFAAIADLVRAVSVAPPQTRTQVYWTTRICLVRRQVDLATFDRVFGAVFDDAALAMDPHARRQPLPPAGAGDANHAVPGAGAGPEADSGLPWATRAPAVAPAADTGDSITTIPERLPGALAGLADVSFDDLDADQLRTLGRWLDTALPGWPTRRSRRVRAAPDGRQIALRPTIARARRTAWEPVELVRVRRVQRPRRIVMLCDVSQSMQAQATAYLHLMRVLARRADAEVFAFATTLTRLTPALAQHSAEDAIAQATARVVDRFGGTRIATNVRALLTGTHGDQLRGAVVLIGSDGWDSDPPDQLAAAMARLRRRAHRVLWLNPRAAAPGFEPRVASMAAALPCCDALLPADTFASLADAIRVIAGIGAPAVSSRGSRGSRAGTARP